MGRRHNWHQGGIVCIDVHPVSSLCITGARDGSVKISNAKTHRVAAGREIKRRFSLDTSTRAATRR